MIEASSVAGIASAADNELAKDIAASGALLEQTERELFGALARIATLEEENARLRRLLNAVGELEPASADEFPANALKHSR